MRKRVATKESVRRLRGSVSQNLISNLVPTSFAPRADLVKIAANQTQPEEVLERLCNGLLIGLLLLLLLVLLLLNYSPL